MLRLACISTRVLTRQLCPIEAPQLQQRNQLVRVENLVLYLQPDLILRTAISRTEKVTSILLTHPHSHRLNTNVVPLCSATVANASAIRWYSVTCL